MRAEQTTKAILVAVVVLGLFGSAWATEGPIAHWTFDEGSGGTAYDSAGGNDGTITGATWTSGQINGALDFDGSSDYVNIGRPAALANMGSGTIMLWLKPSITITSAMSGWISLFNKNASGVGLEGDTFVAFRVGKLKLDIINDSGTQFQIFSDSDYWPANVWQHATVTWDNSTGAVRMYINGTEQAETLDIFTGLAMAVDRDVVVGGNSDKNDCWFNGVIDEVAVYDRALSDAEIWGILNERSLEVAVDIKPGSCPNPLNLKSRGVLPVAILGSEDFNVNTIDIASIRLAGVAPVRSSFEDVAAPGIDANDCNCNTIGPDGFTDMVLKFKTQEIVEQIYCELDGNLVKGDWLELLLTGQLADQTPFEGADCVVTVGIVPQSLAAKKADINQDGLVDAFDFSWLAKHWLQSSR